MSIAAQRIERYYDSHRIKGEEVGQNGFHFDADLYLVGLLRWLYKGQQVYVSGELNLYRTSNPMEEYTAPDVVVIKGITPAEERTEGLPSYYINVDGPPPSVVIELSSPKTWREDFDKKFSFYQEIGVEEYFIYDPHSTPIWKKEWADRGRLMGWRRDPFTHQLKEIPVESNQPRELRSIELQSRLVIEGRYLRLYDLDGRLRLNGEQAEQAEKERAQTQAETERTAKEQAQIQAAAERVARARMQAQAEAERTAKEQAQAQIETERTAKERAQTQAEAERTAKERAQAQAEAERTAKERAQTQAETERQRANKLAAFLRQQNFNPDDVV